MNCFQFVFLSGSLTTKKTLHGQSPTLWIAFNLYFYRVHWQPIADFKAVVSGCELLSICIFIGFIDNFQQVYGCLAVVVNCFQFVFLSGSLTTFFVGFVSFSTLWIAFNLYFYRVHWQHQPAKPDPEPGCELLSICIFIGFIDNKTLPGVNPL